MHILYGVRGSESMVSNSAGLQCERLGIVRMARLCCISKDKYSIVEAPEKAISLLAQHLCAVYVMCPSFSLCKYAYQREKSLVTNSKVLQVPPPICVFVVSGCCEACTRVKLLFHEAEIRILGRA